MTLVTHQTGPARPRRAARSTSRKARRIARELYSRMLVDRDTSRIAFIASTEGGMDIEEVAHKTPEKILTLSVDPATGIQPLPRPPHRASRSTSPATAPSRRGS